jgi:hypothetical protein
MSSFDIPENFICPITLDVMRDPVLCEDGFVYDRHVITKLKPLLSPFTRQPIDLKNLKPCDELKKSIDEFVEKNGIKLEPIECTNTTPKYFLISTFYHKNIVGIKVRGIFDDMTQAAHQASSLQQLDKHHNIVIRLTSKSFPLVDSTFGSYLSRTRTTQLAEIVQKDWLDQDPCLQINGRDQKYVILGIHIQTKTYVIFDGYETFDSANYNSSQWVEKYPGYDIFIGDIGYWLPIGLSRLDTDPDELLNKYMGQYISSFN